MATNPFLDRYETQYGLPVPYSQVPSVGSYIAPKTTTTPGTTVHVLGGQQITTPSTVSTTPGYVQWNQTIPTQVTPSTVATPKVAPKVAQPTAIPTTQATTITPSTTTAQTANDLWMRQGETIPQYQARTGMVQTETPTDGSLATIGALSQDQLDEIAAYDALAKQAQSDATGTFNTAGEQTKYTNIYQDRINSINALYNDMIAQSRANNAPVYAAREQQGRLSQVLGGLVGGPMAEAQQTGIQTANQKEQAAAEALIIAQQRAEINAIYGKVDDAVARAQERFEHAKAEGGKTYAEAIKNKNAVRKSILDETLGNVTGKTLSDADIKKLADKLGLSVEYVRNEFDKKNREYESAQSEAQTQAEKDAADLEYKKAQTAKTTAETAQVGKMTPYQQAQINIEQQKLAKESPEKAATTKEAVQAMSQHISENVDKNGWLTPQQYKKAKNEWVQKTGETPESFDAYFMDKAYTDVQDRTSPYTYSSYGISGSSIKKKTGTLPEA